MNYLTPKSYKFSASLSQYGDGVFETMLGVGDEIHHWHYHWTRLQSSCRRLHFSVPNHDALYTDIQTKLRNAKHDFSVVKMIVSRGEGLRGYRSHPKQPCFVQIDVSPYTFNPKFYNGLHVRVCKTRLSAQPLLAGMKHCNRLEYVMARREANDSTFDEGLLLDYDNHLIEGLISNVFVMNGKQIFTPPIDTAGVAGTMRAHLLEVLPTESYNVSMSTLTVEDIAQSEAVFLTNATNGIMPVKTVQGINKTFTTIAVERIRQLTNHPSVRC